MRTEAVSPFTSYMRARAADAAGMPELAAGQYAAAFDEEPGNLALAVRTYRQAAMAGDKTLALRMARLLDRSSALPQDGRLLLLVDNFENRDWKAAEDNVAKLDREGVFSFLAPIVRAWIAFGAGGPDPAAQLSKLGSSALSSAYGAQHRALILLAQGKRTEALDIVRAKVGSVEMRDTRGRLLVAQSLAAEGNRDAALTLLSADDSASRALRTRIESGQRMSAPKIDPLLGIGYLLLDVAIDLNRERVSPLSITLGRFATFASPQSAEILLGTGQLLAMGGRNDAALETLSRIGGDSLFVDAARGARIRLLVTDDKKQDALAEMKQVTAKPDANVADWTLLGDIYSTLDQPAEAADAYGKALAMIAAVDAGDDRLWTLWLLRGSALERAGSWPEAKAALEKALSLAPDEAVVLNHLGYSQLEHRENLVEARNLIEKASRLRPDDAAITDSLGWAHYLQGDVATAITKLEKAVEGDPGGSEINEHLGDAYWTAGRRIEARYAWQAAKVTADQEASKRLAEKIDNGLDKADAAP